jgi:dihydroflavonol-4-reductase
VPAHVADTVLVTGATGFTGGHLARTLAAQGQRVRVLVRDPARSADFGATRGIEVCRGDLKDPAARARAVDGVTTVYNIAAIYRQAGVAAAEYRAVNTEAPAELVRAAARAGARRVVHCSTVGVHGDVEHPPADEDAPFRPGDLYQHTKLDGERAAREAAEASGIELVIARPSGIYGPGDRRLLKLFRGVARRRFLVLGSGRIYYHLTYIDDLVEGFRLCGTVPGAAGRTYILAGGEVGTLEELIALVADEAGVEAPSLRLPVWPVWAAGAVCEAICVPLRIEPPLYRRRVDFFTKSRAFDIGRARAELGFAPQVGLREGIRRSLEWYRAKGWI